VKGGEVRRKYAVHGIDHADTLLWLQDDNGIYGIAAIKNPSDDHRIGVFEKAGVAHRSLEFMLEFGYAFVEDGRRGNGDGRDLMIVAMEALGKRTAFATARVTNDRITKILGLNNFKIIGREYPSDDDPSRLLRIFVRPASLHAAQETQE
jgi:hypothetical protein